MTDDIAILILAAGKSTRMKSIKQLIEINGKTLIEHTIDIAKQVDHTTVFCVLGANFDAVYSKVKKSTVEIIKNDDYDNGLSTSIVAGIQKIKDNFNACLLLLADQPEVNSKFLKNILLKHQENPTKIIATSYKDNVGVPALFPKTYYDELLLLQGDVGAKKIIQKHIQNTILIQLSKALIDLDTPSDVENFKNLNKF